MALSKIKPNSLDVGQIGGRRNLIINGAMQVAQRGTSFSAAGYNLDRFAQDSGRTNTVEQSTDTPEGFTYSHKTSGGTQARNTWTSVELPKVGESGLFYEGNTFTLSFYAKDTGSQSMALAIQFSDSGTALTNAVSIASSSVSLTTDWVRYDYTFTVGSGVTPAGTNDCVVVRFTVSNTSDTIYITGVQLEVGSVATPFEHRSYGEELALCQRYYKRYGAPKNATVSLMYGTGAAVNSNAGQVGLQHSPIMRAVPVIEHTGTASDYGIKSKNVLHVCNGVPQFTLVNFETTGLWFTSTGNLSSGDALHLVNNTSSGFVAFNAEL